MNISEFRRLLILLLPLLFLAGCNDQEVKLPACKWCIPPDCAQQHSHKGFLPVFAGRGPCFAIDKESITFVTANAISKEKAEFKYDPEDDSWTAILQGAGGIKLTRIGNEGLLFEDTSGVVQKYRMFSGKLGQKPVSLPAQKAEELRSQVITLKESSKAGPEVEGKLVYVTGILKSHKPVVDETLGAITIGLGHFSIAEKYGPAGDPVAGSKTNKFAWHFVYSDKEDHVRQTVRSKHFHVTNSTIYSDDARLGGWRVPREFLESVCGSIPMDIMASNAPIASIQADGGKVVGNMIYFGQNPDNPVSGDIRIKYYCIPDSVPVTIIGTLKKGAFASYKVDEIHSLGRLFMGKVPLEAIF